MYDTNNPSAGSTQLTQLTTGESIDGELDANTLGVDGEKIVFVLASDSSSIRSNLKLIQPTTKPSLSFDTATDSVVEGFTSPQTANLTVTLSRASTTPVSVRWETFTDWNDQNEAVENSDYTKASGVLTFSPGVRRQTISVPILNDTLSSEEQDEVFHVRLLDPSNAVLVPGQSKASITISDTWQVSGANGATFTLPAGVDNLTLLGSSNINGIGNSSSNKLLGNSGNNRLDGGAGAGADSMIGGLGDDTYVVRNPFASVITERANEGSDTVEFTPAPTLFSNSYSLENNLENLILTGTQDLSGSGNALNNSITGNSGNNILQGSGGMDTVNNAAAPTAVVVNLESSSASGWGNDTVLGFENVIGSRFNDTIAGDSGNNVLTGGPGADRITGGGGADKFDYRVLSDSLLSPGLDVISDFNANAGGDKLLVSTARAGFLNGGPVSALSNSAIGTKLTVRSFLPHYAASFQVGSGTALRTYIAINNDSAGFNTLTDALIDVTGLSGTIDASHFVTS
ncbi:MAG: bluetail domain-containing putative surface protein [Cyanobacteriota bacterium]|jgi:Ca2+-binding RTX toxin-like protein